MSGAQLTESSPSVRCWAERDGGLARKPRTLPHSRVSPRPFRHRCGGDRPVPRSRAPRLSQAGTARSGTSTVSASGRPIFGPTTAGAASDNLEADIFEHWLQPTTEGNQHDDRARP